MNLPTLSCPPFIQRWKQGNSIGSSFHLPPESLGPLHRFEKALEVCAAEEAVCLTICDSHRVFSHRTTPESHILWSTITISNMAGDATKGRHRIAKSRSLTGLNFHFKNSIYAALHSFETHGSIFDLGLREHSGDVRVNYFREFAVIR
jgi:hypothetical protein